MASQQNGIFDGVANLLPALHAMLGDLAQDRGRARADVLERILADPDAFRAHIDDIDSALGLASPGKSKLRRMLRMAEQAISPTSGRVKDQHYVSQVVLRQFVEIVGAGRVLIRHNLASGSRDPIGTRGVAYLEHFAAVDSRATEKLWRKVEIPFVRRSTSRSGVAHLVLRSDRRCATPWPCTSYGTLRRLVSTTRRSRRRRPDRSSSGPIRRSPRRRFGDTPADSWRPVPKVDGLASRSRKGAFGTSTRREGCSGSACRGFTRGWATGSTPRDCRS